MYDIYSNYCIDNQLENQAIQRCAITISAHNIISIYMGALIMGINKSLASMTA